MYIFRCRETTLISDNLETNEGSKLLKHLQQPPETRSKY